MSWHSQFPYAFAPWAMLREFVHCIATGACILDGKVNAWQLPIGLAEFYRLFGSEDAKYLGEVMDGSLHPILVKNIKVVSAHYHNALRVIELSCYFVTPVLTDCLLKWSINLASTEVDSDLSKRNLPVNVFYLSNNNHKGIFYKFNNNFIYLLLKQNLDPFLVINLVRGTLT